VRAKEGLRSKKVIGIGDFEAARVSLNTENLVPSASQNSGIISEFLRGGRICIHQGLHLETLRGLNRPQLVTIHSTLGGGHFSDGDEGVNDGNMGDNTLRSGLERVENSVEYIGGHECSSRVVNENARGAHREGGKALLDAIPSRLTSDNDMD